MEGRRASEASEHAVALFQIFQTFREKEFMAECKNSLPKKISHIEECLPV